MLVTHPFRSARIAPRTSCLSGAIVACMLTIAASFAAAPPLMAKVTRVWVYQVAPDGIPQTTETSFEAYAAPNVSYSMACIYTVGEQDYLLLIGGATGRARVIELDERGNLAAEPMQKINLGARGWRSAEVVHTPGATYLFLFYPRDGTYRRYEISADGTIDPDSVQDDLNLDLEGKTHFAAYVDEGEPRAFAIESATGEAVVQRLAAPYGTVAEGSHTPGWSSIDHLFTGGAHYRLLYKEVGHPYFPSTENGDEAGRLTVIELDADGLGQGTLFDHSIAPGFSVVRFYEIDDDVWGILAYEPEGQTRVSSLFGSGSRYDDNVKNLTMPAGFDEVLTYRRKGTTYMVGVKFDGSVNRSDKLTGERAARLAQCVHNNLRGRTVGYQLAVNQLGREILNRPWGYHQLEPSPVPLTRDSRLNMGSVGKMMTTITALRLADHGDIDLDASVGSQVDPWKYPPGVLDPWIDQRTPLDLMAQTTGHTREDTPGCIEVGDSLEVDCVPFANHEPNNKDLCDPGQSANLPFFACPYSYVNAHFGMLRQVIEGATGEITTPDIDNLTRDRWLDDVVLQGPSCRADPTEKYFGLCKAGESCIEYDGQTWIQGDPDRFDGWSRSCGAGGWQGSAQDMVRILEGVRANKVLSDKNTKLLLGTDHIDVLGNRVGIGWEPPYSAGNSGERVLGKNGAAGDPGTKSYLTYLPGDAQAALFINSAGGGISPQDVLFRAYWNALWNDSFPCTPMLSFRSRDEEVAGTGSEVDIVDVDSDDYVLGHLDLGGNLRLTSWRNDQAAGNELVLEDTLDVGQSGIFRLMYLSPSQLVVARTDGNGDLRVGLYLYQFSGLYLLDEVTAGGVEDLAIVPLGWPEADFATVLKNSDSKLQIIVWDRGGSAADELELKREWVGDETILEVAAIDAREDGRIVAAVRNPDHKVVPTVFDISEDGTVTLAGSAAAADVKNGKQVRITRVTNEEGDLYVTAMRGVSGNALKLDAWQVDAGGAVSKGAELKPDSVQVERMGTDIRRGKSLDPFVGPYVIVPYIDTQGNAVLQAFSFPTKDVIYVDPAATVEGATAIATLSRAYGDGRHFATSAVVLENGDVQLVNWEALNGVF